MFAINFVEICISFVIGLLSGLISGLIVYFLSKNRERKYRVYAHWEDFLFNVIGRLGISVPVADLEYLSDVGSHNSIWRQVMDNIVDIVYTANVENRTLTGEEEKLFENVTIALRELSKWAKENKLSLKKKRF